MNIHPSYAYPNGLNEGPPRPALKWHWLGRALLVLCAALLALALAWLASNWHDAPALPRPAELARPQPRLAAERNLAYALWGLNAAPERDPAVVGRALWLANEAAAAQLLQPHDAQQREALFQAQAKTFASLAGQGLKLPQGAPWSCDERVADCLKLSFEKSEALTLQRQTIAALGARCEAVVDALQPAKGLGFEEPLPTQWHPTAPLAPLQNLHLCSLWLDTGAALAFRQGRKDEAWRLMARSSQFHRALLAGAHSLIAQTVVQRLWRRHLDMITALIAQDPAWAAQALPLVQTVGAPEVQARRWIVFEAAFGQAALQDAHRPGAPAAERGLDLLDLLQRQGIGFHLNRTTQLMDQQWLTLLKAVDSGLPQTVAALRTGKLAVDP